MSFWFPSSLARSTQAALCLAGLALGWQVNSQAALTINTTRVIYEGDRRSVSLVAANPSKDLFAVQSWVNTHADDTTTTVPFVVSPPLFRLDPGKQQQIQISGLPNDLPADRESLFYFNLQEIPTLDDSQENVLAIALRTRIKLFYRPKSLKGSPAHVQDGLTWSIVEYQGKPRLAVDNPTPWHVTFSTLVLRAGAGVDKIGIVQMVPPLGRQYYDLPVRLAPGALQVQFTTINDYGSASQPITSAVSRPD